MLVIVVFKDSQGVWVHKDQLVSLDCLETEESRDPLVVMALMEILVLLV